MVYKCYLITKGTRCKGDGGETWLRGLKWTHNPLWRQDASTYKLKFIQFICWLPKCSREHTIHANTYPCCLGSAFLQIFFDGAVYLLILD